MSASRSLSANAQRSTTFQHSDHRRHTSFSSENPTWPSDCRRRDATVPLPPSAPDWPTYTSPPTGWASEHASNA